VLTGEERLEAYARLIVGIGVNLRKGQELGIVAWLEHAPLVRALARVAYENGARHVDVLYSDPHVRRALIERGP
jgi:aminopeptidase